MNNRRTKTLDGDDDPFWRSIRAPSHRVSNRVRYLRSELAHLMRKQYPAFDCVEELCPLVGDGGEHPLTLCLQGEEYDRVKISCAEHHKSDEILEAILAELDD